MYCLCKYLHNIFFPLSQYNVSIHTSEELRIRVFFLADQDPVLTQGFLGFFCFIFHSLSECHMNSHFSRNQMFWSYPDSFFISLKSLDPTLASVVVKSPIWIQNTFKKKCNHIRSDS